MLFPRRLASSKYARLAKYSCRQWRQVLLIVCLTLLSAAAVALQPWPAKFLVDHILGVLPLPRWLLSPLQSLGVAPDPGVLILGASIATLLIFILTSVIDIVLTWNWSVTGQQMVANLAQDLFQRLQRLAPRFHHSHPVGDSLSRLTTDTWCAYQLMDGLLVSPAQKLITFGALGVVAWQLNAELAVYALATAPIMAVVSIYFGRRIKERTRLGREAQSRLLSLVQQTLSALPIVQVFDTELRNSRRFKDLAADAIHLSQKGALVVGSYGLVTGLITTAGTALILFVGGKQVLAGALSLGSFLVFIAYLRHLQGAAEGLLKLYGQLKPLEASIDRVFEIFEASARDQLVEAANAQPVPARHGKIGRHVSLQNVTFGYDRDHPVLQDVSIVANAGEIIAIVGASGVGKSTLVSLIPRFCDPWEGSVTIDGIDVRSVTLKSLRDQIAMVLQEPYLLPLSVADNIGYARLGASFENIVAAARAANADEFIRRLSHGYQTVMGEKGCTLSGGEKQRLAIARAFLRDAPILILDEPTSALDAQTEVAVLDALERLAAGRTTFIIAHRISTIRRADRIVVLDRGRVSQTGTHDDLVKSHGLYRRLHSMQFKNREEALAV
jgi:ATP-binding cassette, subfamily B, bacterial